MSFYIYHSNSNALIFMLTSFLVTIFNCFKFTTKSWSHVFLIKIIYFQLENGLTIMYSVQFFIKTSKNINRTYWLTWLNSCWIRQIIFDDWCSPWFLSWSTAVFDLFRWLWKYDIMFSLKQSLRSTCYAIRNLPANTNRGFVRKSFNYNPIDIINKASSHSF